MVFGKNVLVKINISLFLPLVLLLFVTTLAQDDYSTWQYSTKVSINTTSGGANVTGDVPNFPALVRLTSTNFTFAQANANGSDIRFSKADGTHLPYEIERWDGTGQLAEIWVLVDNILGNNNQQFIIMYWGKASASDSSNSLKDSSSIP